MDAKPPAPTITRRLAFTQARNALVFGVIFSLAMSGFQLRGLIDSLSVDAARNVGLLLEAVVPAASLAVYEINQKQVERSVEGLRNYPFVRLVEIVDDFGTVLVEWQRPPRGDIPPWILDLLHPSPDQFSERLNVMGQDVGSLRIVQDKEAIAAHALRETAGFLVRNIAAFVILALLVSIAFHLTLTRPILKIARRMADLDLDNPTPRELPLPRGHEHNELGALVRTANSLIRRIRSSMERQRDVEAALRQSEFKYRKIFEEFQDIYFQADTKGTIQLISPALERMTGHRSDDLVGRNLRDLMARPEDFSRLAETLAQKGRASDLESSLETADGSLLPVAVSAHIVRFDAEAEGIVSGIIRNITEQKQSEEDRRRLEAQLRQAQRLEVVGTLAGGMAHDFNNLLQGISVNLELVLGRADLEPRDRASLHEALRIIGRATDLIARLMTFSRKSEPRFAPVRLSAVIRDAVSILTRTMPKNIDLKVDLDRDAGSVLADPGQVDQIVLNLANNARDAIGDQAGTVAVSCTRTEIGPENESDHPGIPPGSYAVLTVTDNGSGIPPEIQDKIFDPFFTTKGVGKGTGLGLAMTYGIVQAHSGHIQCQSAPGQGTAFRLFFPVVPGDYAVPRATPSMFASKLKSAEARAKATILMVDDEDMIRETTREALEDAEHEVLAAASGEEALKIFQDRGRDIDLVVMDLGMPGMGGETCLREILALNSAARIVVASAYADHPIARDPEAFGATAFLPKPYRLDTLFHIVRNVLAER